MPHAANLTIKVISADSGHCAALAEQLRRNLAENAEVELATEKAPQLPGRAIDAETMIQVIQLGLAALQSIPALTQVIDKFKGKKADAVFILVNTKTGESVRIAGGDSIKTINKKVTRLVRKRGLARRLFRR